MSNEALKDEFEDAQPIPGLEHLGRAIVDERGAPSGSPANYENLRGADGLPPVDVEATAALLADDPALQLP